MKTGYLILFVGLYMLGGFFWQLGINSDLREIKKLLREISLHESQTQDIHCYDSRKK